MNEPIITNTYRDHKGQVCWEGYAFACGQDFYAFLKKEVAERLFDREEADYFESHIRGLASTGFEGNAIEELLAAGTEEGESYAVGEALAEVWLCRQHEIVWPWHMARDKRHPNASLPGADLVGFDVKNGPARLVLGEVKTSQENRCPPGVVRKMKEQVNRLATRLDLHITILRWLLCRCKNTIYKPMYDDSCRAYFGSEHRDICLHGLLIRDTVSDDRDLKSWALALSKTISEPGECCLTALYLPCSIIELPALVKGGSDS